MSPFRRIMVAAVLALFATGCGTNLFTVSNSQPAQAAQAAQAPGSSQSESTFPIAAAAPNQEFAFIPIIINR